MPRGRPTSSDPTTRRNARGWQQDRGLQGAGCGGDRRSRRAEARGPGRGRRGDGDESQGRPRGDPPQRLHQHLRLRPAHGARTYHRARRPDAGPRDHRGDRREGQRRPVPRRRRHLLGAVQHRLRPLPQLSRGADRHLPERQPRPRGLGVRLRGHGRLGRRPGGVRDGAVRGLQPAQVPRPRPGPGEDPRPDDAVGHLPDRLPRRLHRRRHHGIDGVRGRRGPGGARCGVLVVAAGRGGGHRGRPQRRPVGAGALVRLRDGRHLAGRDARGPDRADPRPQRGRLRRGRRRVRGDAGTARAVARHPPRCSTRSWR